MAGYPETMLETKTGSSIKIRQVIRLLILTAGGFVVAVALLSLRSTPTPMPKTDENTRLARLREVNGWQALPTGEAVTVSLNSLSLAAGKQGIVVQQPNGQQGWVSQTSNDASLITNTSLSPIFIGQKLPVHHLSSPARASVVSPKIVLAAKTGQRQRVLIRFQPPQTGTSLEKNAKASVQYKAEALQNLWRDTTSTIRATLPIISAVAAEVDVAGLSVLEQVEEVTAVESDDEVRTQLESSVPAIHVPTVWTLRSPANHATLGQGSVIAIIDTGLDYMLPDFGSCQRLSQAPCPKIVNGYDYVNNDQDPFDDHGHGTHVAGIAAGEGYALGVAPGARFLIYKVLDENGVGRESDIILALQASLDPNQDGDTSDHATVANLSVGGWGDPDDAMSTAVDVVTSYGLPVVVAAGNDGPFSETINSPGTARTAITVAAACESVGGTGTTCREGIASFSSRGPVVWPGGTLSKPDIAAPGVDICSSRATLSAGEGICPEGLVAHSGTSMAAPHITGVVALLLQQEPELSPMMVKERLKASAQSLELDTMLQGAGLVMSDRAVSGTSTVILDPQRWTIDVPVTQDEYHTEKRFLLPGVTSVSEIKAIPTRFPSGIDIQNEIFLDPTKKGQYVIEVAIDFHLASVRAGTYHGQLEVFQGSEYVGAAIIDIRLPATVTATLPSQGVDFGVDPPSSATWTSSSISIAFTNTLTDAVQDITFTVSDAPAGVQVTIPDQVTLDKGATVEVPIRLVVQNQYLVNDIYDFFLHVAGSSISLDIPLRFTKYFMVSITVDDGADDAWYETRVTNTAGFSLYDVFLGKSKKFFMDRDNPVTLGITYPAHPSPNNGYDVVSYVQTEDMEYIDGVANIIVRRSENMHPLGMQIHYRDGRYSADGLLGLSLRQLQADGSWTTFISRVGSQNLQHFETNTLSDRFVVEMELMQPGFSPQAESIIAVHKQVGVNKATFVTVEQQDMNQIRFWPTVPLNESILPVTMVCVRGACWGGFEFGHEWGRTQPTDVFTNIRSGDDFTLVQTSDFRPWDCQPSYCPNSISTPLINPGSKERLSYWHPSGNGILQPYTGDQVSFALAPSLWTAAFRNTNSQVTIHGFDDWHGLPLRRQDYGLQGNQSIPYSLQTSTGGMITGQILEQNINWHVPLTPILNLPLMTFGIQTFSATYSYLVDGPHEYQGSYSAHFIAPSLDPNPPSLTRFLLLRDGQLTQLYSAKSKIQFVANIRPEGGELRSVQLQVQGEGRPITAASKKRNENYQFQLPTGLSGKQITVTLTAIDNANNSSTWTFDLPMEK